MKGAHLENLEIRQILIQRQSVGAAKRAAPTDQTAPGTCPFPTPITAPYDTVCPAQRYRRTSEPFRPRNGPSISAVRRHSGESRKPRTPSPPTNSALRTPPSTLHTPNSKLPRHPNSSFRRKPETTHPLAANQFRTPHSALPRLCRFRGNPRASLTIGGLSANLPGFEIVSKSHPL